MRMLRRVLEWPRRPAPRRAGRDLRPDRDLHGPPALGRAHAAWTSASRWTAAARPSRWPTPRRSTWPGTSTSRIAKSPRPATATLAHRQQARLRGHRQRANTTITVVPGTAGRTAHGVPETACGTGLPPLPSCNAVKVTATQTVPQIFGGGNHSTVSRSSIAADDARSRLLHRVVPGQHQHNSNRRSSTPSSVHSERSVNVTAGFRTGSPTPTSP